MAAENPYVTNLSCARSMASMRPRRMAAENGGDAPGGGVRAARFNEAAANGRGKHAIARGWTDQNVALQ